MRTGSKVCDDGGKTKAISTIHTMVKKVDQSL